MKTDSRNLNMSSGTEEDEDFEDTDECMVETKIKASNVMDSTQKNLRSGTPNLESGNYKGGQSTMRTTNVQQISGSDSPIGIFILIHIL
jgi:hypothetical protein